MFSSLRRGFLWFIGVGLLTVLSSNPLQAQQRPVERHFGLTAYVQNSQTSILVPIWVNPMLTIAPGFSFSYLENSGSRIGFFLMPRIYLDMRRVAPYLAIRVGAHINAPKRARNTTDFLLGGGFGGEYFINPRFSLGVEAIVDGQIIDLGTGNNIKLDTSAAVHANVYF